MNLANHHQYHREKQVKISTQRRARVWHLVMCWLPWEIKALSLTLAHTVVTTTKMRRKALSSLEPCEA
jgi:hypothetical protein